MEKPTILYVDDEPSNLQGFKSIFFKDYEIITVLSGIEALKVLERQIIHIVITDQKMPGMSGVEFLTKAVELYPDVIRIILTGYSDIEVIIKAVNTCGIYRYLTKPWTVHEMQKVIQEGLGIYKLRSENTALMSGLKQAKEELEQKVIERTEEVLRRNEDIQVKQTALNEQTEKLEALNGRLHAMNEELERKVTERTMELELKNKELESKNTKLEEYAFFNAHKLRSPVVTILGLTVLFEHDRITDQEKEEIITKVRQSASELDLLTVKMQQGLDAKNGPD